MYLEKVKTIGDRKVISQSYAARLRGVTRQAVHDLQQKRRLSIPVDEIGNPLPGTVYLDELKNLKKAKTGRPPLTAEQKMLRKRIKLPIGAEVEWSFKPKDGYGYTVLIPATVVRVGEKRVKLQFKSKGSNEFITAWAKPADLVIGPKKG